MKETILDRFLRKYRIRMVKPTIEKYNKIRLENYIMWEN